MKNICAKYKHWNCFFFFFSIEYTKLFALCKPARFVAYSCHIHMSTRNIKGKNIFMKIEIFVAINFGVCRRHCRCRCCWYKKYASWLKPTLIIIHIRNFEWLTIFCIAIIWSRYSKNKENSNKAKLNKER